MASVDEIRQRIETLLKDRGVGAVGAVRSMKDAKATTVDRNYLRDFLEGKKRTLGSEFSKAFAEHFDIEISEIIPKSAPKEADIRKGAQTHLYIAEHMEARGLDDHAMSSRIDDVEPEAFARWRANPAKLKKWQIEAILHAFDMGDVTELAMPPLPKVKKAHQTPSRARRRA